tara:strand:- start:3747 stop:6692 length:2946 start_codon:yes stop_codon:yes gene_type:complete
MIDCPHCSFAQNTPYPDGVVIECESEACEGFFWTHADNLYMVPHLASDPHSERQGFTSAQSRLECNWFSNNNHIFSRINQDFSSILYDDPSDAEFNLRTEEHADNSAILLHLDEVLNPFGLRIQRLSESEHPRGNDPFIIHRTDKNPLALDREFDIAPFLNPQLQPRQDPRWPQWENKFRSDLQNIGIRINNQILKREQSLALERMMKIPASLTIGALPTGFGKTRIMQIAANLLNHGHTDGLNENSGAQGPILIISPLISLRDDQRAKWEEYNDSLADGITPLRCTFLTSTEPHKDEQVIQKLNRGEIDVLCCSPDILVSINSRVNKWLECFQHMPRPFSAMIIDEAHVVGDWGASIIPTFQLLPMVKNQLMFRNPDLRLLLLSATISVEEEKELVTLFREGLSLPQHMNGSYAIRRTKARLGLIFDVQVLPLASGEDDVRKDKIIQAMKEKRARVPPRWQYRADSTPFYQGAAPPAILYTYRKKTALRLRDKLKGMGISAIEYIGSSGAKHRRRALDMFTENQVGWVVGTSAFGMGVDKDDVWIVGYYGLPSSLKDLYQSFGRAARYDDWEREGHRKNGYCKALIVGRQMSFSHKMKLPLTLERIMRSMLNDSTSFLQNGYALMDLNDIATPTWSSNNNQSTERIQETEGLVSEFGVHEVYQELRIHRNAENYEKMVQDARRKSRSKRENTDLFLWALTCAQRSGLLEVCGVHPQVLYTANGSNIRLDECLSAGGYANVMAELSMQKGRRGFTPTGQQRFIVVRLKEAIFNYQVLTERVEEGLAILKQRYGQGVDELNQFKDEIKKGNTCLRKLFASCYGATMEGTKSCIEHLTAREHAMPCSVCLKELNPGANPVEHVWSEVSHFESLFNLNIPQKPIREVVLFDRPNARNIIDSPQHNQRRYIEGPFALHANLRLDQLDIRDFQLHSDGHYVADLTIDDGRIVTVTSLGERIPWRSEFNREAYSVIFDGAVAHVKWT